MKKILIILYFYLFTLAFLNSPTVAQSISVNDESSAVIVMYHRFGEDTFPSTNIKTNQFENHIRAVCALDKLETKKIYNAKMINLIGEDITEYRNKKVKENEFFFDYQKKEVKPKRKMGHFTTIIKI